MPFHEGFPQDLSEYMEQEGKKIAQEVKQRQEAEEQREQEPVGPKRPLQADLVVEAQSWLGSKKPEELEELLINEGKKNKLAQEKLPGRETQIDDLLRYFMDQRGIVSSPQQEKVATSQVTKEEAARRAFLESLHVRTGPEEEELARLQNPENVVTSEVTTSSEKGETPDVTAATEEGLPESEKDPKESLQEKQKALEDQVTAASAREESPVYLALAGEQARVADVLQRQREIFDVAERKNDAKGMSFAAREIERLEKEHAGLDQKINALPAEQLPGKLEPLLRVNEAQQLSREEYAELLSNIQTRKGSKTPDKVEQVLISDFQRREGEKLQQEAQERGKQEFLKVLQQKYELLGRMSGNERNTQALKWAQETAEMGEMRMAQDLLSRCSDRTMRENGLRNVAITLAEQGIDDPELLKWVELGIRDKKFRSQTMIDVTNTKQKRLLREQLEAKGIEPARAQKLLDIIKGMEAAPNMEAANKRWETAKTALKWGAIGLGTAGAGMGLFVILKLLFPYIAGIMMLWAMGKEKGRGFKPFG
ncbi:MAG: hypothetical protein A2806_00520 [Candidatus Terrybacteria bacterium RIFCSPHIGHO2_01_FULL_48_17]|uniref:Uncharacterized protein n=1 Tax=Candidatus Terrybacteria bacterium RIFCSPHIGHO2_01_FULL_48_17 TaxID=1802362 RepID=A0A1G2PK16_9BACT|nr:MAG: hypothetical protein A2806_00520 [Candidatus Terrybacteria bacterium RIFCSPHIGHO2_01_FULL_48_17]OHA53828.1 MAG: hypothetical protein A3A30_01115 [Candidatus Terrybacteria bacterium RIFCSPLOWO2_01_FULL_48_14]